MISDGIMPTNEGRGYVLRRLIRRAARHGRLLGIEGTFLAKLSAEVISGSKDGYPELEDKKEFIFKVLTNEENQFNKTIDQGLRILADMEEEIDVYKRQPLSVAIDEFYQGQVKIVADNTEEEETSEPAVETAEAEAESTVQTAETEE